MEQNTTRRQLVEEAAKAGLVLGLISTSYLFLTQFIGGLQIPSSIIIALNAILWTGKFGGCIWAMIIFMRKIVKMFPDADNSTTFRFGVLAAIFSSLVYAAASFANIAFIAADTVMEQMNTLMQQMAPMMDSNSPAQMEKVIEKLPQLTFFSNLIYSFLYGTILSFILSRNIPSRNPFANNTSDEW